MATFEEGRFTAEYELSLGNRYRSIDSGRVLTGEGRFEPGDLLKGDVDAGFTKCAAGETPTAIARYAGDATSADVLISVTARDAEVERDRIGLIGTDPQKAAQSAALTALGIILR